MSQDNEKLLKTAKIIWQFYEIITHLMEEGMNIQIYEGYQGKKMPKISDISANVSKKTIQMFALYLIASIELLMKYRPGASVLTDAKLERYIPEGIGAKDIGEMLYAYNAPTTAEFFLDHGPR